MESIMDHHNYDTYLPALDPYYSLYDPTASAPADGTTETFSTSETTSTKPQNPTFPVASASVPSQQYNYNFAYTESSEQHVPDASAYYTVPKPPGYAALYGIPSSAPAGYPQTYPAIFTAPQQSFDAYAAADSAPYFSDAAPSVSDVPPSPELFRSGAGSPYYSFRSSPLDVFPTVPEQASVALPTPTAPEQSFFASSAKPFLPAAPEWCGSTPYDQLARHLAAKYPAGESPWGKLRKAGLSDEAWIALTGLSGELFEKVKLAGFEYEFARAGETAQVAGFSGEAALALALQFLNSAMRVELLGLMFGVPQAQLAPLLRASVTALRHTLVSMPETAIEWPTPAEMSRAASLISREFPLLIGCFGFIDGLRFPLEKADGTSGSPEEDKINYSRWIFANPTSHAFIYSPEGLLWHANYNHNCSVHNSKLAKFCQPALNRIPDGWLLVANSTFSKYKQIKTPITKSTKLPDDEIEARRIREYSEALSECKKRADSRGMESIKGSFQRLKVPLPRDTQWREMIVTSCLRLHQLRLRMEGPTKVIDEYFSVWEKYGELRKFGQLKMGEIVATDRVCHYYYMNGYL